MAYSAEPHRDTRNTQLTTQKFRLIWLADDIDELKKNFPQSFTDLRSIVSSIDTFSDVDLFVNFLFEINNEKVFMIVSGGLGKNTVPVIHDAPQLDSVFVFCYKKADHEKWAKEWPKVKGVFNQIDAMWQAVEQAAQQRELIRPRPATVIPKPPAVVRRPLTPEPPLRTTHRDRASAVDDQRQESSHGHHRRRGRSALRVRAEGDTTASNQSHAESMKIERETPAVSLRRQMDVKRGPSLQSMEKQREAFVPTATVAANQHDTARMPEENFLSPVQSFKEPTSSSSPLVHTRKPTVRQTPNSQQKLPPDFEQLERTLIETAEREVRKSLLYNDAIYQPTSLDTNTMDRLQDTLVQTIGKHVTTKKDDSTVMNNLFAELKQVLVDTLAQQQQQQQQQQPTLLRDLIKQTVFDALSEQQNSVLAPTTTTELTNHRKPITIAANREVKITANLKQTRTDATFRQQRDAVVANKRFRDVVQQWSSVRSMADLIIAIKACGKNDLECAWLLFCWIGQNIRYQPYCNNNSAETVFRTRQGVCRGFVSLYHECCSLLGIECSEISGYAKQAFLKPGEELKNSPHAWNRIVIDQYTYLIDPTWGAGGRDNDNKLEDFYFLTSPEELIYTHYCNGYQLLEPEISKEAFLGLPVMKSIYYRLGLNLLSPKQGLNETNENLFKIAIRTPKHVNLFIALKVGEIECPRNLHTLCQRDHTTPDVYNCFIAPPLDGLYEVAIYAKTNDETLYREAINMRLRVSNIADAFTFPLIYSCFTEHNCILIGPLHRLVHKNEEVLMHMIIPNANVIKIQNGDDYIVPTKDEYKKGLLRKQVRVQGDLHVCGRWDDNADSISIMCIFNMV
jgi:transglutaminase/protease-like cytokinesis protein 3